MERLHEIHCVVSICLVVKNLSQESVTTNRAITCHEILVVVQRVFGNLNVASHTEDELLQALRETDLDYSEAFAELANVTDDGNLKDFQAGLHSHSFDLLANRVELLVDM